MLKVFCNVGSSVDVLHQVGPTRPESLIDVEKHLIGACLIVNGVKSSDEIELLAIGKQLRVLNDKFYVGEMLSLRQGSCFHKGRLTEIIANETAPRIGHGKLDQSETSSAPYVEHIDTFL